MLIIFIVLAIRHTGFKILMMTEKILFQKNKKAFEGLTAVFPLHSELNAKSKELYLQISEDGPSSEGGW